MSVTAQITTFALNEIDSDWLIIGLTENPAIDEDLTSLDKSLNGAIKKLHERKELTGKPGETVFLPVTDGILSRRVLFIGLGPVEKLTIQKAEQAFLTGIRKAAATENSSVTIAVTQAVVLKFGAEKIAASAAYSAVVGATSQALYKAEKDKYPLKSIQIWLNGSSVAPEVLKRAQILGESVNLTRELVNRHPEDLYPITFANRIAEIGKESGFDVEIFDVERLKKEKMGSLLAVARGSNHEPRVAVLRYNGGGKDAPLLSLVGKGVTFDSGGLSIKPSDSMITMKGDMAGAATVLGTISAIARLKLPVNIFGIVGMVENMLGGSAYKLGEVLTARNGTTIEVHNTDAEGRLVLADVLTYAAEQKPKAMIDLATLTGACCVALGLDIIGVFTNDQELCDSVLTQAKGTGEEFWQLPMHDFFNEQLKADFADVKNVGSRWGGATTAAKFLEKFIDGTPWVHLDIAGPAFAETAKPYRDIGGTGVALRTLVNVAENFKS